MDGMKKKTQDFKVLELELESALKFLNSPILIFTFFPLRATLFLNKRFRDLSKTNNKNSEESMGTTKTNAAASQSGSLMGKG